VIIHSSDDRQFDILKQIEEKVDKYGVGDKVGFDKNRYSDKKWIELVTKADCMIIPSYSEGFSFVAVEACALCVPVIHSGKGALSEVVSGKHLVFENMDPKDLALKMQLEMEGKFVETPIREFRLEDTVNEYISLYSRL
jgi:glycosyltransferase involved in cell wall biosynthesis